MILTTTREPDTEELVRQARKGDSSAASRLIDRHRLRLRRMGVVYEAKQISLDRRVALKVLPFAGVLDARQFRRTKNEARAAAGFHHPNIVPVYAVGCERGIHFDAMQYVEGQFFRERKGVVFPRIIDKPYRSVTVAARFSTAC